MPRPSLTTTFLIVSWPVSSSLFVIVQVFVTPLTIVTFVQPGFEATK